jgi:quercetin dioxygenase-like cupin family protein
MINVVKSSSLDFRQLPGRRAANPFPNAVGPAAHGLSVRLVSLVHVPNRALHEHPHSAEVVYVISGAGRVRSHDGDIRVSPGDVVLIPPQTPHATLPDPDTPMMLVCFFPHPDLMNNITELDEAASAPE